MTPRPAHPTPPSVQAAHLIRSQSPDCYDRPRCALSTGLKAASAEQTAAVHVDDGGCHKGIADHEHHRIGGTTGPQNEVVLGHTGVDQRKCSVTPRRVVGLLLPNLAAPAYDRDCSRRLTVPVNGAGSEQFLLVELTAIHQPRRAQGFETEISSDLIGRLSTGSLIGMGPREPRRSTHGRDPPLPHSGWSRLDRYRTTGRC